MSGDMYDDDDDLTHITPEENFKYDVDKFLEEMEWGIEEASDFMTEMPKYGKLRCMYHLGMMNSRIKHFRKTIYKEDKEDID